MPEAKRYPRRKQTGARCRALCSVSHNPARLIDYLKMNSIKHVIATKSARATQQLGEKLGGLLHGPALITLEGDLGCGKTTFSQGLAKGLEVPEAYYVTSPSFAIINEYPARLPFYHMDFYRLNGADELEDLGFFDIVQANGVVAIEWAAKFPEVFNNLPHLEIKFSYIDTNLRQISLIAYGQAYENLVQKLVQQPKAASDGDVSL